MGADIPFIEYAEVNPKRNLRRGAQYPFLEMNAVPEGGGEPAYFTEREYDGGGGSRFAVGDTLFARITPCTENGKIAYVADLNGSDVAFGSTELIVLSARGGKAEPRFIYQVAAWERVRRRAVSRMLGTSGRQRVPTWFFTEELTVPAFTMPEQRAIAAVLDAIDDAIERTEAVIAATERLREALLNELLTRGVPGWHSEWKQVPGLGTVPACWEVVRLGDLLVLDQPGAWGDDPTREDPGVLVLRAADLTVDGRVTTSRAAHRRLSALDRTRRRMLDGDLMLERSGGSTDQPVGRVALIEGLGPVYCNNFCQHLRLNPERCHPRFAAKALWHRYVRGVTARLQHRTTGIRNLDYPGYLALPFPLPELKEQEEIASALAAVQATLDSTGDELRRLIEVKATTADGLLTGRVRIPG